MILLIDNYDSFTYNLYQYLSELGAEVKVLRNDVLEVADVALMKPDKIVISPGPGTPNDAGISIEVIRQLGSQIPILGVCLGHQCIGAAFGATVGPANEIMHGKTSLIQHDGKGVFQDLPNPFQGIRYHSLAVFKETLPKEMEVTAQTKNGTVMGLRHRKYPIEGVQFHPESIVSSNGKELLANFLRIP
jgi:anthranilate synthase/aminodeoxychorismate synthase-like glutamine amidotransferase